MGVDPKWYIASNELAMMNSLKMKMALIMIFRTVKAAYPSPLNTYPSPGKNCHVGTSPMEMTCDTAGYCYEDLPSYTRNAISWW